MSWIFEILLIALGVASLACFKWVLDKYISPWLDARGLTEAAITVVKAVEAEFGRYQGAQKWLAAIARMIERGYNTDEKSVTDELLSAWKTLDLEQIAVGAKESPVYDAFDNEDTSTPVDLGAK